MSKDKTINEDSIKLSNVRNSAKTLGVYLIPILSCKDEFAHAEEKTQHFI